MTMSQSNTVRQFESLVNLSVLVSNFQNLQISTVYEDLVSFGFRSGFRQRRLELQHRTIENKAEIKSFWLL